jgi:ceramide glucosyltransferase
MLMGFLLLLALVPGAAYWIIAWIAVRAHLRAHPQPAATFTPLVSVLKPICGADATSYENFASFCRQDYPNFEVLFGVREADDPAIAIIERIRRDFPNLSIRLIMGQHVGANRKASTLHYLAGEARGNVLVLSDGDIHVEPDYLRRIVAPLEDPAVGVVNCLYRGQPMGNNWVAHLAALHMNVTFLPSVVLASTLLGVRVGLGASMAIRADDLRRIGGFPAIADYLADDYQLASRIADLGLRIQLTRHVVTCRLRAMPFAEQWDREIRWARTIRVSSAGYCGLLLAFLTPQAVVLALTLAGSEQLWPVGMIGLSGALLLRWLMAWRIMRNLRIERIGRTLIWLPVRDVLSLVTWLAGLFGRGIVWADHRFLLQRDGRLVVDRRQRRTQAIDVPRWLVTKLDHWLLRRQGVWEYSQHARCMMRIGLLRAREAVQLSDGARLEPGEAWGELHFWNERLPQISADGANLAWAAAVAHGFQRSLRELAKQICDDPRLKTVRAFRVEVAFAAADQTNSIHRIMAHSGFELIEPNSPPGFFQRCHRMGEELLMVALRWTYNPGARNRPTRRRFPFWISTARLINMYANKGGRHGT